MLGTCRVGGLWTCIPYLDLIPPLFALLNVDVDGEMRIYVSHLVLVSLRHAGDEVLNDRLDGSESSDIFA